MQSQCGERRPSFLITVDTEGDNLWACPREITARNACHLARFQTLCEKYGFKPTWLTNYEMALSSEYVEFARDAVHRGMAEVGMHLHAWNSPPIRPLTEDDFRHQPYLIEYSDAVMREKIAFMTNLLEERFEQKIVSHRAGRWGFNSAYAKALVDYGYRVDCSVTPHISWAASMGAPEGAGGPDFRRFPELPYYVDLNDVSRPGDSELLEVPVTVAQTCFSKAEEILRNGPSLIHRAVRRFFPPLRRMIPCDKEREHVGMMRLLDQARIDERKCVVLATHSSELTAGFSPSFPDEASIERLYARLDELFAKAAEFCRGATLGEFAEAFENG